MNPKRITIIPFIHGKLTRDGKMSEPDIYWIMEKWLERHPEIKTRMQDVRVSRGTMTLPHGGTQLFGFAGHIRSEVDGPFLQVVTHHRSRRGRGEHRSHECSRRWR